MAIHFPYALRPRDVDFWPANATGPRQLTLTGGQSFTVRDAGSWRARVVVQITDRAEVLAARGFAAALSGGTREVIVPVAPEHRPMTRDGKEIPRFHLGPLAQGLFTGGAYAHTEPVLMSLKKSAELRDTEARIEHPGMLGLQPGHYFSIGNRLYLVSEGDFEDFEYDKTVGGDLVFKGEELQFNGNKLIFGSHLVRRLGEAVQNIKFWPPLRSDADAGEQLVVGSPVCKMTVQNPEEVLPRLDRGISGQVEFQFRESF